MRTAAGRRLRWFFGTEAGPRGAVWPRVIDARLAERIVEEFVPRIEEEAAAEAGPTIRIGGVVYFEWAQGSSSSGWSVARVVGIGGTSMEPGSYTVTLDRLGPPIEPDPEP